MAGVYRASLKAKRRQLKEEAALASQKPIALDQGATGGGGRGGGGGLGAKKDSGCDC